MKKLKVFCKDVAPKPDGASDGGILQANLTLIEKAERIAELNKKIHALELRLNNLIELNYLFSTLAILNGNLLKGRENEKKN